MGKQNEIISEILCDKDLDSVAGGSADEVVSDFDTLYDMGLIDVKDIEYIGAARSIKGIAEVVCNCFAKAGIKYDWNEIARQHNAYLYNGKSITQQEALDILKQQMKS